MRSRRTAGLLVAAAAVAIAGTLTLPHIRDDQPAPPEPGGDAATSATVELAELGELAPSLPPTPPRYDRGKFGPAWEDLDGNGCDTRDDILVRDLTQVRRAADGCTVLSGVLADPYTGRRVEFRRGPHSGEVQIDHIYPLHLAWLRGAWLWTAPRRAGFANDPANLIATWGPENEAKGDSGPGQWMPPLHRCAYAVAFIRVAHGYDLTVTQADRAALTRALASCPPAA